MNSILKFIKMIFGESAPNYEQDYSELDKIIKIEKTRLDKFYNIVGYEPLKQIDWILENSLTKFNDLHRDIMSGNYIEKNKEVKLLGKRIPISIHTNAREIGYSPASIEDKMRYFNDDKDTYVATVRGDTATIELRGGVGNRVFESFTIPIRDSRQYINIVHDENLCECGFPVAPLPRTYGYFFNNKITEKYERECASCGKINILYG